MADQQPVELSPTDIVHSARLAAQMPFSLPLTVTVLQRTGNNLIDTINDAGVYSRAFADANGAWLLRVGKTRSGVDLVVYGTGSGPDKGYWAKVTARILGLDVDLRGFYAAASQVPGLAELAQEMAGVKPPRYPDLWEALVNGVIFQQVSIESATSIMRRFVQRFSRSVIFEDKTYYAFPQPQDILGATIADLRAVGCSQAKAVALLMIAESIASGALDLAELETLPNSTVMARLVTLRGVGPWTATIVLLRGMGRLDVFPPADSGAARSLLGMFALDKTNLDAHTAQVLELLGPYKGMLYYHLLLWRLKTRAKLNAQ